MFIKYSDEWWKQEVTCGECHKLGKRSDMVDIHDLQGIYYKRVHNNDDCIRKAINSLAIHARPYYGEYLNNPTEYEMDMDEDRGY